MRTSYDKNAARLQFQSADMLNAYNTKLTNEANEKIAKDKNLIMESAYTDTGAFLHNQKVKTAENERRFNYANHFTELALTEAVSQCVEDSLLLNLDEYAKLNPNYKTEIHDTVAKFISNNFNEEANSEFLTEMFRAIKDEMPPVELYLSEEDEKSVIYTKIMPKETINNSIDSLIGDVRTRVANIVSKDQESLVKEKNDLDYASNKELNAAPEVPVTQEIVPQDVLPDPDASTDIPEPPQQVNQTQPVPAMNNAPSIVSESVKHGIIETLTINEASSMLAEGKEYDKTLALANAIKYVTILETLDATGIVKIGKEGYNKILEASGVNTKKITPVQNKVIEEEKAAPVNEAASRISEIIRNSFPEGITLGTEHKVFEPLNTFKVPASLNENYSQPVKNEATYVGRRGDILTESELRTKFEKEGFDLDFVDFEDLARDWLYVKKH